MILIWYYLRRWSVWHDNPSELFPKTLKQAIHELWPNLRLTVDRIDCPYTRPPFHTTSFPALNLVEVLVDDRRVSSSTEPLQRLLVASKNLETLRIEFIRNPFTSHAGRLPPVRKLVLGFRLWDYTPEESVLIWDFSRLEALFIRWHTLLYLDPMVNKSGLTRLTRLVIAYDWPGRNFVIDEDAEYNAARTLILRRIIEQIPHHQLQELDIKCQLSGLPLTSIVCHGNTLRMLTLLDTSGFETDGVAPVTTSTADLQLLLNTCSRLVNLSIAVDFDGFHVGLFLISFHGSALGQGLIFLGIGRQLPVFGYPCPVPKPYGLDFVLQMPPCSPTFGYHRCHPRFWIRDSALLL